jgi:hypothetical protein
MGAHPDRTRQRLALIATRQAEAARLLSAANHETLKARVRLALRDLDEAFGWLRKNDVSKRPPILQIVDAAIDRATEGIVDVATALADPKATEIS